MVTAWKEMYLQAPEKIETSLSATIASVAAFGGKNAETSDLQNQFLEVLWDRGKLKTFCPVEMVIFQ